MRAALQGHLDVIRVLLAADPPAEVNQRDVIGRTALYHAVDNNHPLAVRMLLAHGANVDGTGTLLLMLTIEKGYLEVVEELLRVLPLALLNGRTMNGTTALMAAVNKNFPYLVDTLLAAGANPNIAMNDGYTPLMTARNADMARRLLYGGADVDARYQDGTTALMFAASDDSKDPSLVALLLERGADVNASRSDGWNSLMLAAFKGRTEVLVVLLAADPPAEVNQQSRNGSTALFLAVTGDRLASARLLLDADANPFIVDNTGSIPLMRCTSPEAAKMLVNAAPDMVNHTCNKGRRALAYLTRLDLLEELFTSCARHNIQIDVNHADINGDTALHMAMLSWSGPGAVKLLLEKGADVFGVGYGGTTVLMRPFMAGDRGVIAREYGIREAEDGSELADATISESLRSILDRILCTDVADAPVPVPGRTGDGMRDSVDTEGGSVDEPAERLRR
jgi:ankyrin repeat protein